MLARAYAPNRYKMHPGVFIVNGVHMGQPLHCINNRTVIEIIFPFWIQRIGIIKKCAFAV